MNYVLALTEEDRQFVLLALAKLSLERPGWDTALNIIALRVDNNADNRAEMYDKFRALGPASTRFARITADEDEG